MRFITKKGEEIRANDIGEAREIARKTNEREYFADVRPAGYFQDEYTDSATAHLYTDSHAYSIVKRTAKTITLQRDKATLKKNWKPDMIPGGFSAYCTSQHSQEYDYEKDPDGVVVTCRWSEKYHNYVYKGLTIYPGRHEFYDYNF